MLERCQEAIENCDKATALDPRYTYDRNSHLNRRIPSNPKAAELAKRWTK
jgi:hypothetical protein